MFNVYENLLPQDKFSGLYVQLKETAKWQFTSTSHTYKDTEKYTFWFLDLTKNEFFSEYVFSKICEVTGKNFTIDQIRANGQTYGQCGDVHSDHDKENAFTFLYYVNSSWNIKYGGATVFCSMNNKIHDKLTLPHLKGETKNSTIETFYPKPNTGILFPSNISHLGLEPTRYFKDLRITVAYKLVEIK